MEAVQFYQRQSMGEYKQMHEGFKFAEVTLQPVLMKRFKNCNPSLTSEVNDTMIKIYRMNEVKPADVLGKLLAAMADCINGQTVITPHGNLLLQRYRAQISHLWDDKSNKYLAKLLNQYCEPHLQYICRKGKLYFINLTASKTYYIQTKPLTLVQEVRLTWESRNYSKCLTTVMQATGCDMYQAKAFVNAIVTERS